MALITSIVKTMSMTFYDSRNWTDSMAKKAASKATKKAASSITNHAGSNINGFDR